MLTESLFTTFEDRAAHRVDQVLKNEQCPWPAAANQIAFLRYMLYHRGKAKAMPIGDVAERLKITPREVKELVQDLRLNFGVQIGASRESSGGGYYLATTLAEVEESISQMWKQAITMLMVCRGMRGPQHSLRELLGQLELELTKENPYA